MNCGKKILLAPIAEEISPNAPRVCPECLERHRVVENSHIPHISYKVCEEPEEG